MVVLQTQRVQEMGARMLWVVRIVAAMLAGLICYLFAVFAFDHIFISGNTWGHALGMIFLLIFVVLGGLTLLLIKRDR